MERSSSPGIVFFILVRRLMTGRRDSGRMGRDAVPGMFSILRPSGGIGLANDAIVPAQVSAVTARRGTSWQILSVLVAGRSASPCLAGCTRKLSGCAGKR